MIGIAGLPGAGKTTYAAALVADSGVPAVCVPLDGFHLADRVLDARGLRERKGAPETFDVWGYVALLARLRAAAGTVYAPAFERDLEQPLAGAIAVDGSVDLVVTEGSYLLLDRPGWREARALLDEVWFVDPPSEATRLERLVARHVRFGKSPEAALAWVERVDDPNAALVTVSRSAADRVVLTP